MDEPDAIEDITMRRARYALGQLHVIAELEQTQVRELKRQDNLALLLEFEPFVDEYAQRLQGEIDYRQRLDQQQPASVDGVTELRDRLNLVADLLVEIRRYTAGGTSGRD